LVRALLTCLRACVDSFAPTTTEVFTTTFCSLAALSL
jgi:hypothetical protein